MSAFSSIRSALHPLRAKWVGISDSMRENQARMRTKIPGQTITHTAEGQTMHLACKGTIAEWIMAWHEYEPGETKWFASQITLGMTILDIGANVGYFSILAGLSQPTAKIFAFEPIESTNSLLTKNIELNKLSNVTPIRLALSDSVGTATMHINASGRDGLNTMGKPAHSASKVVGTETVDTKPLDDFLAEKNVTKIDLIKIDVEGAELLVFKGAQKLLASENAPTIMFEVSSLYEQGFGYKFSDIIDMLSGFGYQFESIDGKTGETHPLDTSSAEQTTAVAFKR